MARLVVVQELIQFASRMQLIPLFPKSLLQMLLGEGRIRNRQEETQTEKASGSILWSADRY